MEFNNSIPKQCKNCNRTIYSFVRNYKLCKMGFCEVCHKAQCFMEVKDFEKDHNKEEVFICDHP